jgi:hypothetical protein
LRKAVIGIGVLVVAMALFSVFVPSIEERISLYCPPNSNCPYIFPASSTVSFTFYLFRFGGVYFDNSVYQFRTALYQWVG